MAFVPLINIFVILYIVVQVSISAKRGTIKMIAPVLSYVGALVLCRPISVITRPIINPIIISIVRNMSVTIPQILQRQVSEMIFMTISYLITVLLIRFVFSVLRMTEQLPGAQESSRIAAGCMGLIKAIILIWLISLILQLFGNVGIQLAKNLYKIWDSSKIVHYIDQYNMLKLWLLHA